MRAPSLLSHCLTGMGAATEKGSPTLTSFSDHLPSPAVEILPSKSAHPYKYAGENVDVQGLNVFKGRVSVADIIGFNGSETTSSKPEGYLKSWDSSIDLVNVLKHEIRDGQLSFRGKRVLELGCNYGLPGIFAFLKGASTVHFQDVNAETIRCTTIPNVLASLEQAREKQSRQAGSPLTPSRQMSMAPSLRFYAGDWEELPTVLSLAAATGDAALETMRLSFSEEDNEFSDGQGSSSRKLSAGSRAWERASHADTGDGGYDIILLTDIPHSPASLKKLYALINKCLKPPYGVAYIAAKKNYVGFNSGVRHLRSLVDEEAIFGAHLVNEMTDRDVWKFFLK